MKNGDETLDAFYHGRIRVLQKRRGYRFAVDSPLLADFIQPSEDDELLEFGTGNGIISLLLSIKPFRRITALEIQPDLADLARRNVRLNHLEAKISVVEQDLCDFCPGAKYDLIFSNPPYHRRSEGHLSPSEEKSVAKHELKCTISDIMLKTSALLKKSGKACFVFPQKRKDDLFEAAAVNNLKIRTVRDVCPRAGDPPQLFLVECDFFAEKSNHLPDLVLYDREGQYSGEVQNIFSGRAHAPTF